MIAQLVTKLVSALPPSLKSFLRAKKLRYTTTSTPEIIFTNHPTIGDTTLSKLTIGLSPSCYLVVKPEDFQLPFLSKSVKQIEVRDFLSNYSDYQNLENFFSECHRILADDGTMIISSINLQDTTAVLGSKRHLWDYAPSWCKSDRELVDWLNQRESSQRGFYPTYLIKDIISHKFAFTHDSTYAKITNHQQSIALPSLNQVVGTHNVYLGYADPISLITKLKSRLADPFFHQRKLITVGGSGMYLNLIPYLQPQGIVIYDINPLQVEYTQIILKLISHSSTRTQFISNLFSRPYLPNAKKFLQQPKSNDLYHKTKQILRNYKSFDATIGSIAAGEYKEFDANLYGLKIKNNSYCQYLTLSDQQSFYPGTNINYWCLNEGFLKNDTTYQRVRSSLKKSKVVTASLDDPVLLKEYDDNTIAYVTNIGEVDWLRGQLTQVDNEEGYIAKVSRLVPGVGEDFIQAWRNEYRGFMNFIHKQSYNVWIIDVSGNITNMKTIEKKRLGAHAWLWKYLEPKILGESLEIIHLPDNTWGFSEHLASINYQKFLRNKKSKKDTLITHLLLENGVDQAQFRAVITKASAECKKLIIIERYDDRGQGHPVSVDHILQMILQVQNLSQSHIDIQITGAGDRDQSSGITPTAFRNLIISCTI